MCTSALCVSSAAAAAKHSPSCRHRQAGRQTAGRQHCMQWAHPRWQQHAAACRLHLPAPFSGPPARRARCHTGWHPGRAEGAASAAPAWRPAAAAVGHRTLGRSVGHALRLRGSSRNSLWGRPFCPCTLHCPAQLQRTCARANCSTARASPRGSRRSGRSSVSTRATLLAAGAGAGAAQRQACCALNMHSLADTAVLGT